MSKRCNDVASEKAFGGAGFLSPASYRFLHGKSKDHEQNSPPTFQRDYIPFKPPPPQPTTTSHSLARVYTLYSTIPPFPFPFIYVYHLFSRFLSSTSLPMSSHTMSFSDVRLGSRTLQIWINRVMELPLATRIPSYAAY